LPAHFTAEIAQRRKVEIHQRKVLHVVVMKIMLGKNPHLAHFRKPIEHLRRQSLEFLEDKRNNIYILSHAISPLLQV
jgi:flagellar motor component MotA